MVIPSPYRSLVEPLLSFLEKTDLEHNDGQQAVLILPELIPGSSWQEILHNQSADEIKKALLYKRRAERFAAHHHRRALPFEEVKPVLPAQSGQRIL